MVGMRVPRVLLVDSDRNVTRMLRSCLELSGRDCIIVESLSGEDALLELGRGPVDLLVTDLRLPGISGLDLLVHLRGFNPQARSILIASQLTPEARSQAEALGVVTFVPKPVSTNFFLEAVDHALNLSLPLELPVRVSDEGKAAMAEGLMSVLGELGGVAAYLVDESGDQVVRAGDLADVDLKSTLTPLIAAFRSGLKISSLLGSLLPSNSQYFDGDIYDVYLTNVGSFYGLVIVFDGKQDLGKIGTVVRVGRRAADDMLSALSTMAPAGQSSAERAEKAKAKVAKPRKGPVEPARKPERKPGEKPAEGARPGPPVQAEPSLLPADEKALGAGLEAAARKLKAQDADEFWEEAAASTGKGPTREDAITFDEARDLGLIPQGPQE